MSQLLNVFIIDLVTVKAFVFMVLFVSMADAASMLHQLVVSAFGDRTQIAFWLVVRTVIIMVALLILYSSALEVYVQ